MIFPANSLRWLLPPILFAWHACAASSGSDSPSDSDTFFFVYWSTDHNLYEISPYARTEKELASRSSKMFVTYPHTDLFTFFHERTISCPGVDKILQSKNCPEKIDGVECEIHSREGMTDRQLFSSSIKDLRAYITEKKSGKVIAFYYAWRGDGFRTGDRLYIAEDLLDRLTVKRGKWTGLASKLGMTTAESKKLTRHNARTQLRQIIECFETVSGNLDLPDQMHRFKNMLDRFDARDEMPSRRARRRKN